MDEPLQIGCVVYSRCGRDSGRYYAVVNTEQNCVYVADGDIRQLRNPKKKNIKHVKANGKKLESIAQKLIAGKKVYDNELKSALREYNQTEVNNG